MSQTPVALFAFNRPEHTERALAALSKCSGREACRFIFFCDGARGAADEPAVRATREALSKWAPEFGAELRFRDGNAGLASAISQGVSELVGRDGRVIVLEDDLAVSPDFLRFMLAALDRYEDEPSVMQVGGLTLCPRGDAQEDAFLIPVTTTWGWATWARAWAHFDPSPKDVDAAWSDADWVARFDLNGAGAFSAMLRDRLAGRNQSWGILWWYAVSRRSGLVVYPSRSLVHNGGFDGSGIHCTADDFLGQDEGDVVGKSWLPASITFPAETAEDKAAMKDLESFFRGLAGGAPEAQQRAASGLRRAAGWVGRRLGFARA